MCYKTAVIKQDEYLYTILVHLLMYGKHSVKANYN